MKKDHYKWLIKLEEIVNKLSSRSKLISIPKSWIRYEDNTHRSHEIVKAYEMKYRVKVKKVYIIPARKKSDTEEDRDGDFYFPDEDKQIQNKKHANIYCFILKNN